MESNALVFTVRMEPAPIYITQNSANPYVNPTLSLVFQCYDKSNSADPFPTLTPLHAPADSSYIDVYCQWEEDEKELLCSIEEARKVKIINLQGADGWTAKWNDAALCWRFFPPAGLSREFMTVFGLDGLISSVKQGTALLYATPTAISEIETYAFSVGKQYPISITSFIATPEYICKGKETILSWITSNASSCFLGDDAVNITGSKKLTVTQDTDITLYARNAYNQEKHHTLHISLTNWSKHGSTDISSAYLSKDIGRYDLKLFEYNGSLYFFANRLLHYSNDSGTSFQTITPDAGVLTLLDATVSNHDTYILNGRFYLFGNNGICSYGICDKTWTYASVDLFTAKGGGALSHRGISYYFSMVSNTLLAIFIYTGPSEKEISLRKSINIKKDLGLDIEIIDFDITVCLDTIYIGLKSKQNKTVYLLSSYDLDNWKISAIIRNCTGWFRLIIYNDRLLLLTRSQIIDPIYPSQTFPHFLPSLKEDKPVVGTSTHCENDELLLIAQRQDHEDFETLWSFIIT